MVREGRNGVTRRMQVLAVAMQQGQNERVQVDRFL